MTSSRRAAHDRMLVAKLDRTSLEDQFFKIQEENHILKSHGRKQEERIKKMAIKLVRLVNERKKYFDGTDGAEGGNRNIGMEEMIEKQQDKMYQITKENEMLKKRLTTTSQQMKMLQMKTKQQRPTPSYREAPRQKPPSTYAEFPETRVNSHVVEDLKNKNEQLRDQVRTLQQQVQQVSTEYEQYKEEMKTINLEHESNVLKLREQMTASQKLTNNDNIELIKLKRNIKEKMTAFSTVEQKYKEIQQDYEKLRKYCEELGHEGDRLRGQVAKAEAVNMSLHTQYSRPIAPSAAVPAGNKEEYVERCKYLEKELHILQEANKRLSDQAFNNEQEERWKELEKRLRAQIALLESAIKSDAVERNTLIDKMTKEQDYLTRLNEDCRQTREQYRRLGEENSQLRQKLNVFTAFDDPVEADELRDALVMVRKRKEERKVRDTPSFVQRIDHDDDHEDVQRTLADTVRELNKTREMLQMQHRINKDYHAEVVEAADRFDQMKRELEDRIEEMAQQLDNKTAKIKKLSAQLRDVAYGTKSFKVKRGDDDEARKEDEDEDGLGESQLVLERGENLFEINISKVMLNSKGMQVAGGAGSMVFVTHCFYDFEMVSTPLLPCHKAHFNYTSQYKLKVDDLFLHYMQRANVTFELHRAIGVDHKTIASCRIKFNKLLDHHHHKLYITGTLIDVQGATGETVGAIDVWVRLRVPVEQALRLYQSRLKALGYVTSNERMGRDELADDDRDDDDMFVTNVNKLVVTITSCHHVLSHSIERQPDVYCMYKLMDFTDHDTDIVPSSNDPVFTDRQVFTLEMSDEVDQYLRTEQLVIYVFDDKEEDLASYLGKANIDLIPLARGNHIKSPFQLFTKSGEKNGTIDVSMRWQNNYKPPQLPSTTSHPPPHHMQRKSSSAAAIASPVKMPRRKMSSASSSDVGKTSLQSPPVIVVKPASTPPPFQAAAAADAIETRTDERSYAEVVKEEVDQVDDKAKPDIPHYSTGVIKESGSECSDDDIAEEIEEAVEEIEDLTVEGKEEEGEEVKEEDGKQVKNKFDEDTEDETEDETGSAVSGPMQLKDIQHLPPIPRTRTKKPDEVKIPSQFDLDSMSEEDETVKTAEDTTTRPDDEEERLGGKNEMDTMAGDVSEVEEVIELADDTYFENTNNNKTATRVRFQDQQLDDDGDDSTDHQQDNMEESSVKEEENDQVEMLEDENSDKEEQPQNQDDPADQVRVSINYLSLDANVRKAGQIENVFIEYDLIGNVEETPDSLPIPKAPNEKIMFNYEKATRFGRENPETRKLLRDMVRSRDNSCLQLLLISDPLDDDDQECEEIGTASVDLAGILRNGRDVLDSDVAVRDGDEKQIGTINMSVEALQLLRQIDREHNTDTA